MSGGGRERENNKIIKYISLISVSVLKVYEKLKILATSLINE